MSSFAGLFIMIGLFALGNDLKTAARTLADALRRQRDDLHS